MNIVSCHFVQMHEELNGEAHIVEVEDPDGSLNEAVDAAMRLEVEIARRNRKASLGAATSGAPVRVAWGGAWLVEEQP